MAAPMTMGKVGKAGKAVLMKKTNNLQVVKDHYCMPPAPGELLVHNVYTSVNPVDCYMRSGMLKVQFFPKVLGSDVAGQVVQAPEGSKFAVFDKVFALTDSYLGGPDARGSYAEYVRVKEEWCAPVPASLPLREAAAVPLVGLTAWQALQAAPQGGGRRILILGASGGVGQFAVQLACLRGLHVTGTCGADHAQLVRDLGAEETFDYAAGCDALGDAYGSSDAKKFDVILDLLGGDLMRCAVTRLLKPGATVIHVRNRGADEAMVAQLQEEVSKRGCAWHSIFVRPSGEMLAQLAQLIEAGKLRVHVAAVMPLEEVAKAHELVEGGHAGGKIVLKVA